MNLMLGDCLERMKEIESGSVDLILTDPPYGTTACKWDSVIDLTLMWEQLKRIIKPNGAIVLFGSQPFSSLLITSNIDDFSHQWVWDKVSSANPLLAKKMPLKTFEDVLVFYKKYDSTFSDPRRVYFEKIYYFIGESKSKIKETIGQGFDHCFRFDSLQFSAPTEHNYEKLTQSYNLRLMEGYKDYAEIKEKVKVYYPQMEKRGSPVKKGFKGKNRDDGFMGGVVQDTVSFNNDYYPKAILKIPQKKARTHPTQKPVALMEYLIRTYTQEGETVLDFVMGSGTTGLAAKNLNRKFIGIEKDAGYFEIAKQRLCV